jgi:uncharacterized protein (DUF2062 family)
MVGAVSGTDDEPTEATGRKPGWWRRLVVAPVMGQLKQGIAPDKLGWSIGIGVTIGIFPVWGTRAWICLLVGWLFQLNQPVLHAFKSLLYPVQVLLLIPFMQMGQLIFGKPPLKISIEFLKGELARGPLEFWSEFGWLMLRATVAWMLVAPVLLFVLKWTVTPLLRRARWRNRSGKEAAV